jgi:hypothetical protein
VVVVVLQIVRQPQLLVVWVEIANMVELVVLVVVVHQVIRQEELLNLEEMVEHLLQVIREEQEKSLVVEERVHITMR